MCYLERTSFIENSSKRTPVSKRYPVNIFPTNIIPPNIIPIVYYVIYNTILSKTPNYIGFSPDA